MNRFLFGLVAFFTIVIGLLVGTLNADQVQLDLLWVQLSWPLGLLLLLSLSAGFLLGIIMIYFSQVFPLRLKLRKSKAEVARAINSQVIGDPLTSREVTGTDD
jgi:putative membrane protein